MLASLNAKILVIILILKWMQKLLLNGLLSWILILSLSFHLRASLLMLRIFHGLHSDLIYFFLEWYCMGLRI